MVSKPRISKGTRDFSPKQLANRDYIFSTIKSNFKKFGFQPIETPSFELSETLLGKYGEEGDRLVFKLLNSGEKVKNADTEALAAGHYQKFSRSLSENGVKLSEILSSFSLGFFVFKAKSSVSAKLCKAFQWQLKFHQRASIFLLSLCFFCLAYHCNYHSVK